MSCVSGSPPGSVGSGGISGRSGVVPGVTGMSGTPVGISYSACIANLTFPSAAGIKPTKVTGGRDTRCANRAGMRSLVRCFAALVASITLLAEAPADEAQRTFATTGARTAMVRSYTSKLHVDFALRSFPYLKVHLEGDVKFERPNRLSVHFHHVPWFGKGFENLKADPLEPGTWAQHYDVTSIAHEGERTVLEMREKVPGNLKDVHAELDNDGLRRIQWLYDNGGKVDVNIVQSAVDGVPLPTTEDADIRLPAYHVVAHATFTDYHVVSDVTSADGGR